MIEIKYSVYNNELFLQTAFMKFLLLAFAAQSSFFPKFVI